MAGYTPYGYPNWIDGSDPGVAAEFLNPLEQFLTTINSAATDSNISSLVGILTVLGLKENGPLLLPYPSVQTLANNGTITLNTGPLIVVSCSATLTGIIMAAGSTAGQVIFLYVSSSFGLTFAASGSRVRNGSNITLNAGHLMIMVWDGSNWGTCP